MFFFFFFLAVSKTTTARQLYILQPSLLYRTKCCVFLPDNIGHELNF